MLLARAAWSKLKTPFSESRGHPHILVNAEPLTLEHTLATDDRLVLTVLNKLDFVDVQFTNRQLDFELLVY